MSRRDKFWVTLSVLFLILIAISACGDYTENRGAEQTEVTSSALGVTVWKFQDGDVTCYISSGGGIWCME